MQRYFIHLSYNGKPFNGWQIQPNAPSVQEKIEEALSMVLRYKIKVTGCGRTDTGVHAEEFFAHFDTEIGFDESQLVYKLNGILPREIAIYKIWKVSADLHARFSATSRTYHYYVNTRKSPFDFEKSWYLQRPLHIEAMNAAAQHLLGTQDFTSFSKLHTQTKTNICTVTNAQWEPTRLGYKFTITADRFLHNMVRAIVGTLVDVGCEKISVIDFREIIQGKDRQKAGASAPAHGLFLTKIKYKKQGQCFYLYQID